MRWKASIEALEALFSMGMLAKSDWTAKLIGMPGGCFSGQCTAAPWFRSTVTLPSGSAGPALLYVASVGFCEVSVNGQSASEAVLSPSISYLPANLVEILLPGFEHSTVPTTAPVGAAATHLPPVQLSGSVDHRNEHTFSRPARVLYRTYNVTALLKPGRVTHATVGARGIRS